VLICRTEIAMEPDMAKKISLFCNVRPELVIEERDVAFSIYEVPLMLIEAGLDQRILNHLQLVPKKAVATTDWQRMLQIIKNPEHTVEIAVSGKYIELHDAYKSIYESLSHAGISNACKVKIRKVSAEQVANEGPDRLLGGVDGILVPGGFGERGFEGKIASIPLLAEAPDPVPRHLLRHAGSRGRVRTQRARHHGRDDDRVRPQRANR
jgi:CTP synthase